MCDISRQEWDALNNRVTNLSRDVFAMETTLSKLCKDEQELSDKFNETLAALKVDLASMRERLRWQWLAQWVAIVGIGIIIVLQVV